MGDFWDSLHRARFRSKMEADTVTCEDCGKTFSIETAEQRERLEGGCPNCGGD